MTYFGDEKFCLECCDKLIALQAWPGSGKINVEQWLSNFDQADRPFAQHMVSQFIYVCNNMIDAQFESAFQCLSNIVVGGWKGFEDAKQIWNAFLASCLIVPVQGEVPNPADSGYAFARKARQVLGINEEQLFALDDAIEAVDADKTRPIIFVDDFVGSGEQFTKTLVRESRRFGFAGKSIANITGGGAYQPVYYCNVAMTQKGKDRIAGAFPDVVLSSGNVLGPEYSWISVESRMWPDEEREKGIEVIERYSKMIGYIDDFGSQRDWRGFHCLGLGLAFEHSTPDATLPLFFSEMNGWNPLVTRR